MPDVPDLASRAQAREELRDILWEHEGNYGASADAVLADFPRLAALLGYVKADAVRAARKSALSNAADVVHAEARWQTEQDMRGIVGAQIVAQRMRIVEACIRAFADANEVVSDGG